VIVYLDTSVVLRHLFGQPEALDAAGWQRAYSSEILGLEARRAIDRLRLESSLDDDSVARAHEALAHAERSIHSLLLARPILRRAALPMPTVVKTLHAIHLASALIVQEHTGDNLTFATHDSQQATCARALGLKILGC
jgi:predicted nucleic acid-binding protein